MIMKFTKGQKIIFAAAILIVLIVKIIMANFMDFTWHPGDPAFQVKFVNNLQENINDTFKGVK